MEKAKKRVARKKCNESNLEKTSCYWIKFIWQCYDNAIFTSCVHTSFLK